MKKIRKKNRLSDCKSAVQTMQPVYLIWAHDLPNAISHVELLNGRLAQKNRQIFYIFSFSLHELIVANAVVEIPSMKCT